MYFVLNHVYILFTHNIVMVNLLIINLISLSPAYKRLI